MNDNPPKALYPPDFIQPQTVEDMGNHVMKLTFSDGFSCYAPSQDEAEWIYNEIMVKQEYFQNWLSIEGARCVMDIGANLGIFTMAVKLKAPDATVHAFEPIPETFQVLEQNVRLLDVQMFTYTTWLSNLRIKSSKRLPFIPICQEIPPPYPL